jgi:hypothetical protein
VTRSGSSPAASGGGTAARPQTAATSHAVPRREGLRDIVANRRACLEDLSSLERRVLVLRAGVGPSPPLSRASVARRLRVTVRRVARVERAGLRRLLGLCRGGASSPAVASKARLVADHPAASVATKKLTTTPGGGVAGTARSHPRTATRRSRPAGRGHPGSGDALGSFGSVPPAWHPSIMTLIIPLILIALALGSWAVVRMRRGGPGEPVALAAPPEPRVALPPATRQGPSWFEDPETGSGDTVPWSAGRRD